MRPPERYRILLVDDDPDDRRTVSEDLGAITRWRAEVTAVASYEEALRALETRAFDVALVDYRLGARRGIELLEETAIRTGGVPVIILTGADDPEVDLDATRAGASDFLPKNAITPVLLERSIRYTVAERRRHHIEARFRAMIEHARDLITVLASDGTILYMSPSIESVLGSGPGEKVDQNALQEIHPDDRGAVADRLQQLVATPNGSCSVVYRVRHVDGSWRTLDSFAQNMLHDPFIGGVVVNSRDVTDLLRAQADLARTAGTLQQIMAALEEAIFVVDTNDGTILRCNAAVESMFGYAPAELAGQSIAILHTGSDSRRQFIERVRGPLERGDSYAGEWRMRRRDGSVFPSDHLISLLDPQAGLAGGVVHVVRDRSEAIRQQQQMRFQAKLLELVGQPVMAVDDSGLVTYWNAALVELTGWTADEVIGRTISDVVVVPEHRPRAAAAREVVSRGGIWREEIRIRTKDGRERLMLATSRPGVMPDGSPGGRIATAVDVTDLRRTEAERADVIRRAEFQARLLGAVGEAIVATDLDERVIYWNHAAEALYGWTAAEAIGRVIDELTPSTTAPEQAAELSAALDRGESWTGELEVARKDGSRIIAEVTDAPITDDDGERIGVIRVSTDVSERRQLAEQLRQAQKMEAVGRLAGGIAHDFNNLLTAIKGHAALLLEDLDAESPQADDVRQILSAGDRAATMTRQLLAFSRKQVLEARNLDLAAVAVELEPMLRRLITERIRLEVQTSEEGAVVRADPTQIQQVVMNLVVNAVDAISESGTIVLRVDQVDITPREADDIPWQIDPGRYARLCVEDSGVGMSEDVANQIFEPFFTTKPEGRGTGLGLATVYGIVKQSGGHIMVDTAVGRGTRFEVLLPAIRAAPTETPETADEPGLRRGNGEVVLLVEDDHAVRGLARRILERFGYRVVQATNGLEALDVARDVGARLAVVVSDVVMPQLGGAQLADRLRAEHPHLKVILTSGYSEAELRGEIRGRGAAFLRKPFTAETLIRTLGEVLDAP